MATVQLYNHTVNRFNEGLNSETDTYKVVLLNATASFNATHTTLDEVSTSGANEVSGNGWPVGGATLANVTFDVANTNGAAVDADDVSQAISGGSLGPYSAYVVVNASDANSPPLAFWTMPGDLTVPDGFSVSIKWGDAGLISWTVV